MLPGNDSEDCLKGAIIRKKASPRGQGRNRRAGAPKIRCAQLVMSTLREFFENMVHPAYRDWRLEFLAVRRRVTRYICSAIYTRADGE